MPTEEAIDLINVAFEQKIPSSHPQNKNGKKGKIRKNVAPTKPARNFSVPDRITGISGLEELQYINPLRQWNFIEVTGILLSFVTQGAFAYSTALFKVFVILALRLM